MCFADEAWDRCTDAPPGTWRRQVDRRQRPGAPIVVGPDDVCQVTLHPEVRRRIGCCGVSYRQGEPNLLCRGCGAEVGYMLTDGDHVPWAAPRPSPSHCCHSGRGLDFLLRLLLQ